ncbi:MAG TPA: undecaprenyldiphospho-muramoylpentapeptide beta-N-acetylglucosaminyltransferase [Solirubrobacteraceae bacterium]|nr:undecaprenyldiphospho-muramoylpentapeptide beta-N-acetylglucosaminyltransferase [Solirubrobacteraceae bacterium]
MSKAPRIAIAAGGTAGHVVPALAVADALRARGAEVVFIGGDRAERELVPAAGYPFERLSVSALDRRNPLRALRALTQALGAVLRARSLLRGYDAVMGGGGYVAGPVGLAALLRRIPIVLTEADSRLGIANRVLAPFARSVCLAFPIRGRDGERYVVTGRPVAPPDADRAQARAEFGVIDGELLVLVFGGSLGSRRINEAAIEGLDGDYRVLHVTGARDWPSLSARPRRAGYDMREYLDRDRFAAALAASDLVIARSGGSIFEIAAYGRPAILVPYPAASAGHQLSNARWMERAGAAVVLLDGDCDAPRLRAEVARLVADAGALAEMSAASLSLARPQAASEVAELVLAAAVGRA